METEPAESHDPTVPGTAEEPAEAVATSETTPVWAHASSAPPPAGETAPAVPAKGDPDWTKPEQPPRGDGATKKRGWAQTVPTDPGKEPAEAESEPEAKPAEQSPPRVERATVTDPPRAVAADALKSTWPPAADASPAPPDETDIWPPEPPTQHAMPAWPPSAEVAGRAPGDAEEPATPAQAIPSWPDSFDAVSPAATAGLAKSEPPMGVPKKPAEAATTSPREDSVPPTITPATAAGSIARAKRAIPAPAVPPVAPPAAEAAPPAAPPAIAPTSTVEPPTPDASPIPPTITPTSPSRDPEPAPAVTATPAAPPPLPPLASEPPLAPTAVPATEPVSPAQKSEPARPAWAPQPAAPGTAATASAAPAPSVQIPSWAPRVPLAAEPGTPTWFSPREQIPHSTSQPIAQAEPPPEPQPLPPVVGGQLPVAPVPAPAPPAPPSDTSPPSKGKPTWEVVRQPKAEHGPQGPTAEDRSYAEWFAWAKRGGAPATACHAAAQGAFKALASGKDVTTAVQWATAAMSRPPENVSYTRQTYCAWFSLANIDLNFDQHRAHAFANAALHALDAGQDAGAAHAAGLAAAGIR